MVRGASEQKPHRSQPAVLARRTLGHGPLETQAPEQGTPPGAAEREHALGEAMAGGQQLQMYLQEEETLGERRRQLENQVPAGVDWAGCGKREMLSRQTQHGRK